MKLHFILTLIIRLEGCKNLKEKRSRLASLLNFLKKMNVSVIESNLHDNHQEAELCIIKLSQNAKTLDRDLEHLLTKINTNRGDIDIINYETERVIC